jgi:hypothetical protein
MKYCLCEAPTREHDMTSDFDVRSGSLADIEARIMDVRFASLSGHIDGHAD